VTAPVRDRDGRFTHDPEVYTAPPPRDGYRLRHDPAEESARRRLREALAALQPATPPCTTEPDRWYPSDRYSPAAVVKAIAACGRCPVRRPCGVVGESEVWGVWGGIDRDRNRIGHREWQQRQRQESVA
jgi:hypothetical protein